MKDYENQRERRQMIHDALNLPPLTHAHICGLLEQSGEPAYSCIHVLPDEIQTSLSLNRSKDPNAWACWETFECKIMANQVWRSLHAETKVDPF